MTRNSMAKLLVLATAAILSWPLVAVPACAQRVLTLAEGKSARASFEAHQVGWRWCRNSIEDGPNGSSVKVIVNCRGLPGATFDFDLFKSIGINPAWVVVGAAVDQGQIAVSPSGTNPFTQLRLTASWNEVVTRIVTVTVTPSLPTPLPMCKKAGDQTPLTFVCVNDDDCSKPRRCSAECGNRCTE